MKITAVTKIRPCYYYSVNIPAAIFLRFRPLIEHIDRILFFP